MFAALVIGAGLAVAMRGLRQVQWHHRPDRFCTVCCALSQPCGSGTHMFCGSCGSANPVRLDRAEAQNFLRRRAQLLHGPLAGPAGDYMSRASDPVLQ